MFRDPGRIVLHPRSFEWGATNTNDDEEDDGVNNHEADSCPYRPLNLSTICALYKPSIEHQNRDFRKAGTPKELGIVRDEEL